MLLSSVHRNATRLVLFFPQMCEAAPCAAKAAPNLDVNTTPSVSVPADANVLPFDPNLAGLLEKVAGLKEAFVCTSISWWAPV